MFMYTISISYFVWNLDDIAGESWRPTLKFLSLVIVLFAPAFQHWTSYYRRKFLKLPPTVFEKYGTSILTPLVPLGYQLGGILSSKYFISIYLITVVLGVISFADRSKLFSQLLPLDRRDGDIKLFRNFPPTREADFSTMKALGFGMLCMSPIVGLLHR